MGPLIALPLISMVGKMVGGASDVAEATAQTAAATTAMAIFNEGTMRYHDPDTGRMVKSPDAKGEAKTMFGGMPLGKIKSALDDDGSINPPEISDGPLEVNKMMLSSLQKIESTLKLMLELEHDRTEAFQQQEVQDSLTQGDTDPYIAPDDNQRGLFGRAKDMLGGVYDKAKGGFGKLGAFGKLLGLGGLLLLMSKFREDIIGAMAKTMEWFKGAYDYFTAEDFSFEKLATDFKEKFMPKLFETLNGILGSIFSYVKESMFGASGDKSIQQQARAGMNTASNLSSFASTNTAGMNYNTTFGLQDAGGVAVANDAVESDLKGMLDNMRKISQESDGRIQWNTFPDKDFSKPYLDYDPVNMFKNYDVPSILNAQPVIDGMLGTWNMLSNINLDERAGISKAMDNDTADKIRDVLKRKTEAYQSGQRIFTELNNEYMRLGPDIVPGMNILSTEGSTSIQQKLNKTPKNVTSPFDATRSANASQIALADQSTINHINAGTVNNVPMVAVNNQWSARLYANANTVLANSNMA